MMEEGEGGRMLEEPEGGSGARGDGERDLVELWLTPAERELVEALVRYGGAGAALGIPVVGIVTRDGMGRKGEGSML